MNQEQKNQELEARIAELEKNSFTFPINKRQADALEEALDTNLSLADFLEVGPALFAGRNFNINESNENQRSFIITGADRKIDVSTSDNSQLEIQHLPNGLQTFFHAFRPPLYTNDGASITSTESTLTDTKFQWDTDELAGAYINIYNSSGTMLDETNKIASNTATEITIDGTWGTTDSDVTYFVWMPVYFGSADFPWRRGYFGEDIRLGFGTSAGSEVTSIKWGDGSPEGSVTANIGSLWIRTDGGGQTTLYIKESGSGNTGWRSVNTSAA